MKTIQDKDEEQALKASSSGKEMVEGEVEIVLVVVAGEEEDKIKI
jgi:hypothetical protein